MKNILAIDTASAYLSLALQAEGKTYKYIQKVDNKQSENIIPQINELLVAAGIEANDINYIAYNQGPGSFTGLRIGLSVALGIAFGIKALLIPIPAFAIYALQAYELSGCSQVMVGLDARLSQLYYAGIDANSLEYFIQPELINPDAVIIKPDTVIIGSGFTLYKKLIPKTLGEFDILDLEYPDATYLLKLADREKLTPVNPPHADLLYLRNKVALNIDEQKHKTNHTI
jgi:tRNA threonylcarbamoyladenosine biosynthesis protein TsaB